MKKLLLYLLAAVASLAWVFIILALSLALFDPGSSIHQDPVLVSIAVLVFIIIFIQKRPQGIFAMKGRSAEA